MRRIHYEEILRFHATILLLTWKVLPESSFGLKRLLKIIFFTSGSDKNHKRVSQEIILLVFKNLEIYTNLGHKLVRCEL